MALGFRRTRHRPLGLVAMKPAVLLLPLLMLAGCKSSAEITGFAAGGAAGAVTGNPAVGYAVGIGTVVAADELFKWIGRSRAHAEQVAIATAAAGLPEGAAANWRVRHTIPIGNEGGEVWVTRVIDTPLTTCRDIVFSVADHPPKLPAWYFSTICHDPAGWDWAMAEPAVPRWGFLQQ